jgi:TPR repeat protein
VPHGWWRKAADQGYAPAQAQMGLVYANGIGGVPKDFTVARSWYQKAADQGNTIAKEGLTNLDAKGPKSMASNGGSDKADLQSKINDLKEDAEANEQAAENFEQQAQVLQGPGGSMAAMLATQKRQKVQSINRQISELQSQMQAIQSQPETRYPTDNNSSVQPNSTPAVRTSAVAGETAAPAGGTSGSAVVGSAASGCWSSELDAINDPIVRARLGNNRVQQIIQIAQGGGAAALDQQIGLMQQEEEQAKHGIRDANQDIAATAPGGPEASVTPRECADRRQTGNMSARAAAMCQRLSMQNMLHLASGLIEVMQCVRASIR